MTIRVAARTGPYYLVLEYERLVEGHTKVRPNLREPAWLKADQTAVAERIINLCDGDYELACQALKLWVDKNEYARENPSLHLFNKHVTRYFYWVKLAKERQGHRRIQTRTSSRWARP